MKKSTEQIITKALLPSVLCAVVFSVASAVSFEQESAGGFAYFSLTVAIVAWISVIVEVLLVYEALVDKWFSKDHSIIATLWFVASIYFAISLTPNKAVDLRTFGMAIVLFIMIFGIPYYIGIRFLRSYYDKVIAKVFKKNKVPAVLPEEKTTDSTVSEETPDAVNNSITTGEPDDISLAETDTGSELDDVAVNNLVTESTKDKVATNDPTTSSPLNSKMSQEDEIKVIDDMISALPKELVQSLPEKLQVNNCLFLLVLFREEGYLNREFKPIITTTYKDGSVEINQTLYAYIANIICTVLNIKFGKWTIFESFWNLNNAAQLLHNFKANTEDSSSEHQVRIAKMLRRATRLRPKIDSNPLREIIDKH
jgi:hypothetical protein